jgi:SNF2 family DNA or RNA helicase
MKTTETQLALHEQRISAIEASSSRVESKIDLLIERIDNRFVTKLEYERDVKNQKEVNQTLIEEMEKIKDCMISQEQMKSYQRSQFWQKFLTAIGTASITAILIYEITKAIK